MNTGFVERMPRGLMITGRLYDEATVLRFGMAYQRATRWYAERRSSKTQYVTDGGIARMRAGGSR
jgi:Asp-tRNA(Asn)/Glu-tRNA(Gln) amidotransferase A subunit family amidase